MSKRYTTNFLEDTNGNTGVAGQVLVTTATGVSWQDAENTGDNQTQGALFDSKIVLIDTPNGGLKAYRVITDEYGEWIQVGRFAANAMTNVKGTWSSVSGLSNGITQAETTEFSADFGDSFPTEVRVVGATDFSNWRNTRTVDWVYKVPEGRKWKYFFSGGAANGMTTVPLVGGGSSRYGWTVNGAYDGFGRWTNADLVNIGMSDANVTNPSAAYSAATANAFYWQGAQDAKLTVNAYTTYSGQDQGTTSAVGNDDSVNMFFDTYPTQTTNPSTGGTGFSSAVWVLIKLPGGASGSGSGNYWAASGNDIYNTNSGNVGIGTTNPTALLHLSAASPYVYLDDTSTSGTRNRFQIISGDVGTTQSALFSFNNTSGTSLLDVLTLNESGNVGIGTGAPNYKLEVSGDAAFGAVGNVIFTKSNGSSYSRFLYSGANSNVIFTGGAGGLGINNYADSSRLVQITDAGSVGIGTTNPGAYKLNVAGDINATSIYLADTRYIANQIQSGYATDAEDSDIWINYTGYQGGATRFRDFRVGNGKTGQIAMFDGSTGNVGIGTTGPTEKLHVAGRIMAAGSGYTLNPTAPIFGQYSSTRGYVQVPTNGQFEIWNGGTATIATFHENYNSIFYGNVGIGTTNPLTKLHINSSTFPQVRINNETNAGESGIRFRSFDGTNDLHGDIFVDASAGAEVGRMGFRVPWNGTERLTILSTGNVGIGTTSPTQKLEVNGVIESPYLEFKPVVFYDFNSDTTGDWSKGNSTLSVPNDSVTRYTSTGTDSNISKAFNFDGGQNQIIRIRYKVVTGPSGGGEIFYANSQHSYDASYFKSFTLVSDGAWHTLVLDMSSLNAGGTDWIDYNVTLIRFDLTNVSGVAIDIDWISIGGSGYGTQYFENDVAFMDGNVGIGTTGPGAKLDVNGEVYVSPNTAGKNTFVLTTNASNDGRLLIKSDTTTKVDIQANGTSYFNGGNVGIGTTNPGAKLDVNGDLIVATSATIGNVNTAASTTNYESILRVKGKNNYSDGTTWYGDYGQIILHSTSNMTGSARRFMITNALDNNKFAIVRSVDANTDPVVYSTTNGITSGTADFVIDNTGNVGIGTTSPIQDLHVYAAGNGDGILIESDPAGTNRAPALKLYPKSSDANERNWAISPYKDVVQSLSFASSDAKAGDPYSAGTTRMIIDGISGNVGIGTTNPSFPLHVVGYARANGFSVNDSSGTPSAFIGYEKNWIGSGTSATLAIAAESQKINFYAGGTTDVRMMVSSSGAVGIGATNPGTPLGGAIGLVIDGNATSDVQIRLQNNSTGRTSADGGLLSISGTGMYLWNYENDALIFGTNNAERIRILAGGNVGIGSTAPAYKLDVTGTIRATGDVIAYSDARVKENIVTLENSLDLVQKLRGVRYNRIGESEKKIGVIAQEVLEVLPEVVQQDQDGNYSVAYGNITAVLIEAIKQQQLQIDELKLEIKQLKG